MLGRVSSPMRVEIVAAGCKYRFTVRRYMHAAVLLTAVRDPQMLESCLPFGCQYRDRARRPFVLK